LRESNYIAFCINARLSGDVSLSISKKYYASLLYSPIQLLKARRDISQKWCVWQLWTS